jgi:hypothetical protein
LSPARPSSSSFRNISTPVTTDGLASADIYTATRSSPSVPFEAIQRVPALSSPSTDWPAWLSPTGCELYYINRSADDRAELYVARRSPR